MAANHGLIREFVAACPNSGPNGTPREIRGSRAERLYQKMSWTRTGMPRKSQTYSPQAPRITRLSDMRPMASRTPPTMPMNMATAVSSMVVAMPGPMSWASK